MTTKSQPPAPNASHAWQPGQLGQTSLDGLVVQVQVLAVRQAFGRCDLEIQPMAGSGRRWVWASSVEPVQAK